MYPKYCLSYLFWFCLVWNIEILKAFVIKLHSNNLVFTSRWELSPFFALEILISKLFTHLHSSQSISHFSAMLNFTLGFYLNFPLLLCLPQRRLTFCFFPLPGWHSSSVQLVLHPQCCLMRGSIPTTSCCKNFSALEATMLFLSKDHVTLQRSIVWSLVFSVCLSSPQLSKPPILWQWDT